MSFLVGMLQLSTTLEIKISAMIMIENDFIIHIFFTFRRTNKCGTIIVANVFGDFYKKIIRRQ